MNEADQPCIGLTLDQWLELVKRGAYVPVTIPILGTSMVPVIRFKIDPTTIVPLRREPVEGDIVLFRRFKDGALTIHRVYRIMDDRIQTWGDNCPKPDRPVSREDVLGLVVSVCRDNRTIPLDTEEQRSRGVRWMHSPIRRSLWFAWRGVRWRIGNLIRKRWPDFHLTRY